MQSVFSVAARRRGALGRGQAFFTRILAKRTQPDAQYPASICDLPTSHAPQMCKGTHSVMGAWSASKSSEGFISCPYEGISRDFSRGYSMSKGSEKK
jgi:hypothetical protein